MVLLVIYRWLILIVSHPFECCKTTNYLPELCLNYRQGIGNVTAFLIPFCSQKVILWCSVQHFRWFNFLFSKKRKQLILILRSLSNFGIRKNMLQWLLATNFWQKISQIATMVFGLFFKVLFHFLYEHFGLI